jgi:hypothetical protein
MAQYLSSSQRRRVEALARGKGVRCERCGSEVLSSDNTAHVYLGGNAGVDLWCKNEGAHPEGARQPLNLSLGEAQWVGIDMEPRGRPETTG